MLACIELSSFSHRSGKSVEGKFETDVDSFDRAIQWWKVILKTKEIIHRGFGIPIAISQYRVAREQQEHRYENDHEGTLTWSRGVEKCSPQSLAPKAKEQLLGSEQLLESMCSSASCVSGCRRFTPLLRPARPPLRGRVHSPALARCSDSCDRRASNAIG